MADQTVIREFLVSLGFKVDQADKFQQSIVKATELVAKLGTAFEAAAAAALGLTSKVAGKFEDLYYASQRLHSSVKDINAFTYAVSQMGGTSEGARSSLESLVDFLRKTPGAESILRGMGIDPSKGAVSILEQFGQKAKRMPYYMASKYADMLGIDSKTLDALMRGVSPKMAEYNKHVKETGVDQQKAAEASARWAQRFRELIQVVTLFTDKIALQLEPIFNKVIAVFMRLHQATGGWSTSLIALMVVLTPIMAFFGPMGVLLAAISAAAIYVALNFNQIKNAISGMLPQGVKDDLGELLQDFKDLLPVLKDIGQFISEHLKPILEDFGKGVLSMLKNTLHSIIEAGRAIRAASQGKWGEAGEHAGKAIGHAAVGITQPIQGLATGVVRSVTGQTSEQAQQTLQKQTANAATAVSNSAVALATKMEKAVKGTFNQGNLNHIVEFFKGKGASATAIQGILQIMAGETGGTFDPNIRGGYHNRAIGLGQWLGKRRQQLLSMFGLAPNLDQQLQYLWKELTGGYGGQSVLGARTPNEAALNYVKHFEAPGPSGIRHDMRYGQNWWAKHQNQVQINQKTDINVYGGGDPHSTAQATAAAQDRVNGNLVRWNKNAAS